jgi:hypothetical protein
VPYVAESLRESKLKELHFTFGHLSTDSIFDSLRNRCWWPQQLQSLKQFVERCSICQKHRINKSSSQSQIPIPPSGLPFRSIDFIQDLPETESGNKDIIVAVDHATRLLVAEASKDRTARTVALFLFQLMIKYGAPQEIITDRANCFLGDVMKEYLAIQSINHFPTTSYHARTNGMVERVNGVLGSIITKMTLGTREKWEKFVEPAAFILNARKHSTTGFSPFFLTYGLNPRLPGDVFPPCTYSKKNDNDISSATHRELTRLSQYRALTSEYVQFQIGEFVKLKNFTKKKFEFGWNGPFIIQGIGPHNTYYLKKADGTLLDHPQNGIHLATWVSIKELNQSNVK